MTVASILSADRIGVAGAAEGKVRDKGEALERLSHLLSRGASLETRAAEPAGILRVLLERERAQSTGVGGGIAVPHASIDGLARQVGALLVCPEPIDFDALDGQPVSLVVGLVGPKGDAALHLKTLAQMARTFRHAEVRDRLRRARDGAEAWAILAALESSDGL